MQFNKITVSKATKATAVAVSSRLTLKQLLLLCVAFSMVSCDDVSSPAVIADNTAAAADVEQINTQPADSQFTNNYQLKDQARANKKPYNQQDNCGIHHFKILNLLCPMTEYKYNYQTDQKDPESTTRIVKRDESMPYDMDLINSNKASSTVGKKYPNVASMENGRLMETRDVQANRKFHRMKRGLIQECCHKACTLRQLSSFC